MEKTKTRKQSIGKALILAILLCSMLVPYTTTAEEGPPSGSTVHGYVWPIVANEAIQGFSQQHAITVELRESPATPAAPGLGTEAVPIGLDGLGEFTIGDVPPGDYVLYIGRPGYLARYMNVTIPDSEPGTMELEPPSSGTAENGVFTLLWGDCDGSGAIDDDDISMIMELWNVNANDPNYDPACDLDADGRIDNSDALLLMMYYGYTCADYAGSDGLDTTITPISGILNSTVKLALSQGYEYRVPIIAKNIESFSGTAISISFDQTALKLITMAEQTYGGYGASAGVIPGTGITITSVSPGIITFTFDAAIPQNETWSGIITVLKFEALTNGASTVYVE